MVSRSRSLPRQERVRSTALFAVISGSYPWNPIRVLPHEMAMTEARILGRALSDNLIAKPNHLQSLDMNRIESAPGVS